VLSALLGGFASLIIGLPLIYLDMVSTSLSHLSLAGVIAGGAVGMIVPGVVIYGVQAVLYFLGGIFSALLGAIDIAPPTTTPKWLMGAFIFGAAYVAALFLI
jgi:hypothetical protein